MRKAYFHDKTLVIVTVVVVVEEAEVEMVVVLMMVMVVVVMVGEVVVCSNSTGIERYFMKQESF